MPGSEKRKKMRKMTDEQLIRWECIGFVIIMCALALICTR